MGRGVGACVGDLGHWDFPDIDIAYRHLDHKIHEAFPVGCRSFMIVCSLTIATSAALMRSGDHAV